MAATTGGTLTQIYLIRHGESWPQVENVVGGLRGDRGLTPLGQTQAVRLRDRLAATGEIAADTLIASTMPRASQTAEIIAPALGRPIVWDDDVQEVRPGIADGLPTAEAERRFRISAVQREPTRPMSPAGESWEQFVQRVGRALERITRVHAGQTVAIVCHAGVVECSFLHGFRTPPAALPPVLFWTQNTAITHWELLPAGAGDRPWRLLRYNDALHLLEIGGRRIDWNALAAAPVAGVDRPAVPLPATPVPEHPA